MARNPQIKNACLAIGLLLTLFSCTSISWGQSEGTSREVSSRDSILLEKIYNAEWVTGPDTVDIGDIAELVLPPNSNYTGEEGCKLVMQWMGNPLSDMELGYFEPDSLPWFVVFEFNDMGYVSDNEKTELDADEILEEIKVNTRKANIDRQQLGHPTLEVLDWVTKPHYDETTNNLVWAFRAVDSDGSFVVNYNTRILGRRGVMIVTLIIDPDKLSANLPEFDKLMDDFSYKPGNKYSEYREGDKIAEYGLGALIVGGGAAVAAKSGIFKWLWKAIIVGFAAISGFIKKIWAKIRGKNKNTIG